MEFLVIKGYFKGMFICVLILELGVLEGYKEQEIVFTGKKVDGVIKFEIFEEKD